MRHTSKVTICLILKAIIQINSYILTNQHHYLQHLQRNCSFTFIISMGAVRSFPENQVRTQSENQKSFYYVSASMCGWQIYMEDFSLVDTRLETKLFAIIDGHNGPEVAEFCHSKIGELFEANQLIKIGQVQSGLQNLYCELERLISKSHNEINKIRAKYSLPALCAQEITRAGCGIILAAVNEQQIIISNIGMAKCYAMYKKDRSKAILFSGNHIPSNKQEQARVIKNNGFIYDDKVNGIYPYTRSIGDLQTKALNKNESSKSTLTQSGLLTSEPSFFCLRREDISSILLGSSGFWEKNERVAEAMGDLGKSEEEDKQKLEQLISKMLAAEPLQEKLGLQNMSAIYVCFNG